MRALEELKVSNSSKPPADDASLKRLEGQIGLKLPAAYIALLKQINGGHPQLDTFSNDEGEWSVNNFFFVGDDESSGSVIWNYRNRWKDVPETFMPFARDGGGNLFCLDLRGDNHPVIIWLHDSTDAGVYKLANSLEEFIDGLHENQDYI
jgi:cell wall assembly regulator SMI1